MGGSGNNLNNKKESAATATFFFLCLVFFAAVALDQASKALVGTAEVFENHVFAFSLPVPVYLMYLIYAAVFIGMSYYVACNHREFNFTAKLAWVLIFAGAISNIGERVILGYVRDWIYIWTGIFNLADGYIILGIILLLIQSYWQPKPSQ